MGGKPVSARLPPSTSAVPARMPGATLSVAGARWRRRCLSRCAAIRTTRCIHLRAASANASEYARVNAGQQTLGELPGARLVGCLPSGLHGGSVGIGVRGAGLRESRCANSAALRSCWVAVRGAFGVAEICSSLARKNQHTLVGEYPVPSCHRVLNRHRTNRRACTDCVARRQGKLLRVRWCLPVHLTNPT